MKIAVVTPWYGRDIIGGAERLAWDLAHALARNGSSVDVLSTCCKSFQDDWSANFYRSGTTNDGTGVVLHRFPVDARDRVAFGRANAALLTIPRIALRGDRRVLEGPAAAAFARDNITSRALLNYLHDRGRDYDAVLFVPYLYGPILAGVSLVADRAFLIPCVHDEAYAYLEPVRAVFAAARGVLLNSAGEEETAAAIYGPGVLAKCRVIGHAVDAVRAPTAPIAIGSFAPHRSRYVLYLGRQDQTKNVDFLLAAFAKFRAERVATSLQLVLAGPRSAAHAGDGVVDLGAVNESAKASLLTYARALAQPSIHESFSRSMHEAWYAKRPVLVHAECRATARAVEESGGGWIGTTMDDWVRMFAEVDESADEAIDALGERGWAAAHENGTWDTVARRTTEAIGSLLVRPQGKRIDTVVPLGDRAIAGYAHALTDALTAGGVDATLSIAGSAAPRSDILSVAHIAGPMMPPEADAYIAHDGEIPEAAGNGLVLAASHAVAAQLEESGIAARVLPRAISVAHWDGLKPAHERWADGKDVVLSIAPLGADEARRLLDAFVAYLGIARDARLLVFASDCDDVARVTIEHERAELDLENEVEFVGDEPAERYAAYRAATIALAVGRPLTIEGAVTPLWFDIPTIALADATVLETIELCGIVIDSFEPQRVAALIGILRRDSRLRRAMIAEGRRVRARHAPRAVAATLLEMLADSGARTPRTTHDRI